MKSNQLPTLKETTGLTSRYKYEISEILDSGVNGTELRLEAFGNDRHELLKNAYVYDLDSEGSERLVLHYSRLPDNLFAKAISAMKQILTEAELCEVYRAQ